MLMKKFFDKLPRNTDCLVNVNSTKYNNNVAGTQTMPKYQNISHSELIPSDPVNPATPKRS